jgi:hypothetical protein
MELIYPVEAARSFINMHHPPARNALDLPLDYIVLWNYKFEALKTNDNREL